MIVRTLVVLAALLMAAGPATGLAAGKGKSQAGGGSAAHKAESGAQHGNPQHMDDAERGQGRAARVASDAEKHREMEHEKAGKSAAKAGDEPGVFGRVQRFFGFGQSQDQMSDPGHDNERATDQERGPQDH